MKRNKKMAKETTKEVAVRTESEWAVMSSDQNVEDVIAANLGDEGLSASDLDRIKIPAGGSTVWSIPSIDGDVDTKELDCIIIHSQTQRSYWEDAFQGAGVPPDCFSPDGATGIGTPGGDCADCALNQFGSARNKRGKACSEKRAMFILLKDSWLPAIIRIPVSSLKFARKYLVDLSKGKTPIPVWGVYTRMTLVKDKNADKIEYSSVRFQRIGMVEDPETMARYVKKMKGYIETPEVTRTLGSETEDYQAAA